MQSAGTSAFSFCEEALTTWETARGRGLWEQCTQYWQESMALRD